MFQHQKVLLTKDPYDDSYGEECCSQYRSPTEDVLDDEGEILYSTEVSEDDDDEEWALLPEVMIDAAGRGDVDMIRNYINAEMNINARFEREDLLSRACAQGRVEVVELLLECPYVHLNRTYERETPLQRASINGHLDCVQALLTTNAKCQPFLHEGWNSITEIMRKKNVTFSQRSILHLLSWAGFKGQWEAALLALETDHHIPGKHMHHFIMQALNQNNWEAVDQALKRDFSGKEETLCEVFSIAVRQRRWNEVRRVLQAMDPEQLTLEVPLVEAALNGDADGVREMLASHASHAQILNACLLVLAAGGTSLPVIQLVMAVRDTYTSRTFSDALFLASLGQHELMLCELLSNSEADYTFRDLCRAWKILNSLWCRYKGQKNDAICMLVDKTLEMKARSMGI